jgi:N-acetylneuraminic acid mutarotase
MMRRKLLLFLLIGSIVAVSLTYAGWEVKRPMRYPRYGAMVAAINNRIYVIGGMTSHPDTAVRWNEEYNPALDTWVTKAAMPTPRGMGVCGVVNGKIYVIGGVRANNIPVESVEVYDPVQNQWSRRKRLPTRRYEFNGGVIGDNIYIAGGYFPSPNPGFYSDTVEVYNAVRDSWFIRSSMNVPRVEFGAAVCNNRLYTIGGYYFNYQNANEEYSPIQDTWQIKRPIPLVRSGLACAAIGNRIYTIGGQRFQPRAVYAQVERYNVLTDSWSIAESLNIARGYAGAVTLNENIYVVGGETRNGSITTSLEKYTPISGIEESIGNWKLEIGNYKIYPNPFHNQITIKFFNGHRNNKVVTIYNRSGQVVKTLKSNGADAGNFGIGVIWNGTDNLSRQAPAGIYFAQITDDINKTTPLIKIVKLR